MTAQIIRLIDARNTGDFAMADDMAAYLERVTSADAQAMHDHQDSEIARCAKARAQREENERKSWVRRILMIARPGSLAGVVK